MKQLCLLFFIMISVSANSQVYMHDFGSTLISAYPYSVAPPVMQSNLSGSSWTNSTGAWTSYAGNTGEAIALSNSGGSPTITLTINVAAGYKLNITSFDLWRQRSVTGAQNWSMTINGIAVGSGTIPTTGAAIGTTAVTNPVNNLSGTVSIVISLSGASATGTFRLDDFTLNGNVFPNAYTLLDNFNRNDSIRPAIPSSGGPEWWREVEVGICFSGSVLSLVRIKNNLLEISGCTSANATCLANPTSTANMDMTLRYPTTFSSAASDMEWYFNMQQSRLDPDGFAGGQYGSAFVIGSNTTEPNPSLTTYGYAIIFGESGTADPIRLVSFNGTSFNSTTFTNIISVPSPAVKTDYMSIKVGYNPCNNQWSLTVRDDGAVGFAAPATISGVATTAINSTFTSLNLLWMGMVWNHGSSCALTKFDNIYIPNARTNTGTYTWNGSVSTDFQSAYNWTPVRQCIKTTDKLVFNSSSPVSSVLTNIPDQTIGQLTVSNNRTINLSDVAGNGVVSTLTIAGASGTDLQVDAGSTLIFDVSSAAANDAMVINLGAGATASISGTISFNSQFGGTKTHQLLATDALAITVNSGAVIKAMNLSGNPFGISLPQNTVVFNSGSAYECYSGANPFGLAQPASKVIFNTGSVYRHYSTNQPSILGRVYANVEFYENTNISFGGAAAFTVNDLKILIGTVQFTASANSLAINTNIKGDLILSAGTAFNYDPPVASTFIFNGSTVAQKINSAGALTLGKQLTVRLNSSFVTAPQLTVETNIAIGGILDIVLGTLKLNGNITLVSDAIATASVAPITGLISYGTGRFVVERYIPGHSKAWQLLAVPTTTGQTVNAAWQEGNTPLVAGTPGLGTIITSNVPGTGFDIIGGGGSSMKTYDTAGTGSWKGISRTDSAIYNKKGYMLFVRGDRTVTTSAAPATATTLRTTGKLFDPVSNIPAVTSVGSGKFESIGNPYASAIDFSNDLAVLKSANVQKVFYVWDPKLGGVYNYGAYQTFIKGIGTDYTVLPGGGSYPVAGTVQNLVQSGQAFFVHTFGGTGTVSFTENAKVTGSSLVTRPGNSGIGNHMKQLRTNLYAVTGDTPVLLDAVLNEFDAAYSNEVDIMDALKATNVNESIGLLRDNNILVAERRGRIRPTDTIFYNLERLKIQQYEFEFIPVDLADHGLQAFLEDGYLQTSIPISLMQSSRIHFQSSNDPGSYAANRFRIVFKQKHFVNYNSDYAKQKAVKNIILYPNPVSGNQFRLSFNNQHRGKYKLQLVNHLGQPVMEQEIKVEGNYFSCLVQLPSLVPGIYKLIITADDGSETSQQIVIN